MFNEDRSDFAAPVAGFLYIGFVLIAAGIQFIVVGGDFTDNSGVGIYYYLGVIGMVIAAFNLYKAYLVEGVSIGLIALFAFALNASLSVPLAVAFAVLFALAAVVCYMSGILDLTIINGIVAVVTLVGLGFDAADALKVIIGLAALGAAGVALYVAYCDWTFAQEILESYEDEFCCCDDDCDCEECTCGDHSEGCTCEECRGKE